MYTTWKQLYLQESGLNRLISPLLGLGISTILVIYLARQIDYSHFFHLAKSIPFYNGPQYSGQELSKI